MTTPQLLEQVAGLLPDATPVPADQTRGDAAVMVTRERIAAVLALLRDHPDMHFEMLTDLTAVDYLGRTPRFEVVYHLYSLTRNHRLRVKVAVPEADPAVPTASALWKSALWAEREVWDLFGIQFTGHPDLRRILMYPEFVGHPLRKDYDLHLRQPLVPERDPIAQPWRTRTDI
jgi:NADH-quinone oxidoreductase subunit C